MNMLVHCSLPHIILLAGNERLAARNPERPTLPLEAGLSTRISSNILVRLTGERNFRTQDAEIVLWANLLSG